MRIVAAVQRPPARSDTGEVVSIEVHRTLHLCYKTRHQKTGNQEESLSLGLGCVCFKTGVETIFAVDVNCGICKAANRTDCVTFCVGTFDENFLCNKNSYFSSKFG